ncbi:MAG: glycogen/starch/alpha-glucan phosphorylase, partial [Oscillospiraceae bacterium]|nr:glycogen/starch/alpha-glucan phosphorylase [Oscillospiraceae bacterium]
NARLRETIDFIASGALGSGFPELVENLKHHDPYMVLRDFDDYCRAQAETDVAYRDRSRWNAMSLSNIATFGIFSADRSVTDYAENIWDLKPLA